MAETLSAIVDSRSRARSRPALYLGLAADAPRTPSARLSLRGLDRVDIGRGEHRSTRRHTTDGCEVLSISLADARMSSQHARLTRIGAAWILEDLQSKNGTWVAGSAISRRPLEDNDAIVIGHTVLVFRDRDGEFGDLDGTPTIPAAGLATMSGSLAARFELIVEAARSKVPVEITGESGTGKELAARAVHTLSGRKGPFAAINCGALPGTLLEAELFGHKKGAYTGAAEERAGLVRTADGGTLFLDEVAELPAQSQAALLRVIQEGEVLPVGSDRPIKVDLRIVTATHKLLDREVAANRFRADLRARLLGVQVELPPLRDRLEDLGMLVATLLDRAALGRPVTFSADAAGALYTYRWPLNIRELERALAAALAVTRDRIELQHLPAALRASPAAPVDASSLSTEDQAIRDALVASIARHDGNLAAVARELAKDRTQIRRWMKRFGISRDDD